MRIKGLIAFLFFLLVFFLLLFYWVIPLNTRSFEVSYGTGNFSVDNLKSQMQFYPNMRYLDKDISYSIDKDCSVQKKDEMDRAFRILEEKTILGFYPVNVKPEIYVTCQERDIIEGRVFIAGEGGPTKISNSGDFNIIHEGKILLIRSSECSEPNIALHELLHALGFEHSPNPENIMYNFTRCNQKIGEDMIGLINELYSIRPYPDLIFESVSAKMDGMVLKVNVSVRNFGLAPSEKSRVLVLSNDNEIFDIYVDELLPGYGMIIYSEKPILRLSVDEISFIIKYDAEELSKENNKIVLEIKKQEI